MNRSGKTARILKININLQQSFSCSCPMSSKHSEEATTESLVKDLDNQLALAITEYHTGDFFESERRKRERSMIECSDSWTMV